MFSHLIYLVQPTNLLEDGRVDVGQRDDLVVVVLLHAEVVQHRLDGHALPGHLHGHHEHLAVRALELDVGHLGILGNLWKV